MSKGGRESESEARSGTQQDETADYQTYRLQLWLRRPPSGPAMAGTPYGHRYGVLQSTDGGDWDLREGGMEGVSRRNQTCSIGATCP